MRKIMYVVSSVAAALLISALFSAQAGRLAVVVKAGEPGSRVAPAGSSTSLNSPQNKPFIWVNVSEANDYPGYQRVIGGRHNDGTTMYICRNTINGFITPGKLYKDLCQIPWNGKENVYRDGNQVFLTNAQYQWKPKYNLSRAQVESGAVYIGWDPIVKSNLYVCHKQLQDGLHPGKYASANGLCYISWGGKELNWSDGFEILFP